MGKSFKAGLLASVCFMAGAVPALAQEEAATESQTYGPIEQLIVLGEAKTYASVDTTESMKLQQAPITSALALIDNLPGVNVNEGDTFGFDDWSTSVTVRGFTNQLDNVELGTTIDGLPNGGSNYGGGSKANRYVDTQNIAGVEVSQGSADIASRSNRSAGRYDGFQNRQSA